MIPPAVSIAVATAAAYLVGSIPTSHLVGRSRGVDLARVGSGNYGATNVYRVLGAVPATLVVLVDIMKGLLPVLLLPRLLPPTGVGENDLAVLFAIAAVLGHVFSIFLRFRGGKGIATAAGAYLALAPLPLSTATLVWGVIVWTTRLVSAASLIAALVLLLGVWVVAEYRAADDTLLIGVTVALVLFVFWTHRGNLRRLIKGEEHRIKSRSVDA